MKNKDRTCLLIDLSIPTEKNTSLKTVERLSKYKDLRKEIEKAWGMNKITPPMIIDALGHVKNVTENYIGRIPRQHQNNRATEDSPDNPLIQKIIH